PSPIRGAPSERLSGAGHVRCAAMSALAASTPPRNRAQSARCFLSTALATVLAVACGGAETPPPATPPVAIEAEPPAEPSPEPAPEPTEAASAAPAETPPGDPSAELRTAEVIAQVIKDNRQPFRDCYEKGRQKIPELEGTLTLHFVLDPKEIGRASCRVRLE